jgi:hypothetical protein
MTKPTHRITIEVTSSLTDPDTLWAIPGRALIRKDDPRVVKVEPITPPRTLADVDLRTLRRS